MKTSNRNPAMDIVRCFALLFVVCVHFFGNSEFYYQIVDGKYMYVMMLMRSFFMICVPLFMVLSGYFMGRKTLSRSFYQKLIYILSIYILASICCVCYKVLILEQTTSVKDFIFDVLGYRAAPYSWYVEMYIGLFLLCPFLNLIYNNLKTKKEKQILLLTLILLTVLPNALNIFKPDLKWFLNPAQAYDYSKILPNYWLSAYPITYYFIGCYLKEFNLNIRCRNLFLLSVLVFFANGTFYYYRCHGSTFVWGPWQEYHSLLTMVQTILFFAFFDNLDLSKMPSKIAALLSKISELTFGAYLLSWIFDEEIYPKLNNAVPMMRLRLHYFPLVVLIVFVGSLLLSFIINSVYRFLAFVMNKCITKMQSKKA